MASRRSRRKKKGGSKVLLAIGAVALIAGGAGLYQYVIGPMLQKSAEAGDNSLAGILDMPGDDNTGGDAASEPTVKLSQIEDMLTEVSTALAVAEGVEREKALRAGYSKLSPLLTGPLPVEERLRAIDVFHRITDELFMGSIHNEFSGNYVVKGGDDFGKIAARVGIGLNMLYDMNGIPRGTTILHPGDNLKVPPGKPRIEVRKRDYCASLYFGKHLVRQYIVAHGKNNNTPLGKTSVSTMTVNPELTSRGANDPVNEMKLRWIGLSEYAGGRTGFGFHGTQHPESIPGMSSRGCIRMHDGDVVELYDVVREGTPVEIKA